MDFCLYLVFILYLVSCISYLLDHPWNSFFSSNTGSQVT